MEPLIDFAGPDLIYNDRPVEMIPEAPSEVQGENLSSRPQGSPGLRPTPLRPILEAISAGETLVPRPSIGTLVNSRDGLLYRGSISSIAAEAGTGKSWSGLALCRDVIKSGKTALYVDAEEIAERRIARLVQLGLEDDEIAERFVYIQAEAPVTAAGLEAIVSDDVDLVLVDSVGNAMGLDSLSPMDPDDCGRFFAGLRPLSNRGVTVVVLDHVTKDKAAKRKEPFGSVRKFQEVDVQLIAEVEEEPGRGRVGKITLTSTKDRLGHIGLGPYVDMKIDSSGDEVDLSFAGRPRSDGEFIPTARIETVATIVESHPGIGVTELRQKVSGRVQVTDEARDHLERAGYIEARQEGRKTALYSIRNYPSIKVSGAARTSGAPSATVPNQAGPHA